MYFEGKTVVIGLGNPYMRDDGVRHQGGEDSAGLRLGERVFVYEAQGMDLSLLWQFKGSRKMIVLDALRVGGTSRDGDQAASLPKGDELESRLPSLHALELYDLFDLAATRRGACFLARS